MRCVLITALILTTLCASGCVRRSITISTDPAGALVWVNDREIGRTPVTVDFSYYGTYDVRIERDGYEPMMTYGRAKAPWWDTIPLDLAAEVLPGERHSDLRWHFTMQPMEYDPQALHDRARSLRDAIGE
jgi:hypothetical protein